MKRFLLPAMLVLLFSCTKQEKNNAINIGRIDSLDSKILGEKRKIWVYVPDDAVSSKKRYPVVYLLDGDAHFSSVVGMIQQFSSVNGNTICPNMIVVGIPNTDRTRDLTPTRSLLYPDGTKSDDLKSSGGGEKFVSFIEKELIPHIDSVYPVEPYKMLIGHSFGGLTVMNIVIHHAKMFNSYVAIDPSMWWDKRKLLNQAGKVLKQHKFDNKSLFLGIANTMPPGMDTLQVRVDTTGTTGHIRSILALKDSLQGNKADGLNFTYRYYKDDNHGSVPLIAEYDALHLLFSFYNIPEAILAKMRDPKSEFEPATALTDHYLQASHRMGYTMLPDENFVNQFGYSYMQNHAPDKAYAMFALNIRNYPQSWNVYDSMGDYYIDQKNNAKAIEYYKKAMAIKEMPATKKKLDSLQHKK